MCIDLHQSGSVSEGSDHLQLIKFRPSYALRKVVCGGTKIFGSTLLQPAHSVCVSPSAFFITHEKPLKIRQLPHIAFTHCSFQAVHTGQFCNRTNQPMSTAHKAATCLVDKFLVSPIFHFNKPASLNSRLNHPRVRI